jgi:peptidylprolyl isomerase
VAAGKGDVTALKVTPVIKGTGPVVKAGQQLAVNYVGVTYKDGKEFDSSWKSGQPAQFPVGVGQLIKGWDEGLVGVPVGSRVQLDIPADKAYGEQTTGGRPAGDLRFVVDILQAQG